MEDSNNISILDDPYEYLEPPITNRAENVFGQLKSLNTERRKSGNRIGRFLMNALIVNQPKKELKEDIESDELKILLVGNMAVRYSVIQDRKDTKDSKKNLMRHRAFVGRLWRKVRKRPSTLQGI